MRATFNRVRSLTEIAGQAARQRRRVFDVLHRDLRTRAGRRSLAVRIARPVTNPAASRAHALRADGRFEEALAVVDRAVAQRPTNKALLAQRTGALISLGELSAALGNARTLASLHPTPHHKHAAEMLAGRLRELDPAWLPDVGAPEPLDPADPDTVLHVLKESRPYHDRGYTMRTHYSLQAQRAAGLLPTVVTSLGFPRLDGFDDFDPVEIVDGVPHHRLDLGPDFPYRATPFDELTSTSARLAAQVARAVRPAVLHAHSGYRGYETALVALAIGRRFGLPVVYDVRSFLEATWTADVERSRRGEHYRLRLARELACMRAADLVFTIADTMRDTIVDRGIDSDRVVVIPNAVDHDEFRPRPPDIDLQRSLGLDGRVVLGYISNIGRREGLDILVDAIARLRQRGRDVGGLIVGDGPELAAIRTQIRALGLGDHVKAIGKVPHADIGRYYSIIDVFVIPRRGDEAARLVTPLKPFEAMAMERPMLVADLPALVEVAAPGERGMTFGAEDPDALAAAAETLIADPELRARLGRAGRAWVERERTWARNGQRYREAYARVLDAKRHAALPLR